LGVVGATFDSSDWISSLATFSSASGGGGGSASSTAGHSSGYATGVGGLHMGDGGGTKYISDGDAGWTMDRLIGCSVGCRIWDGFGAGCCGKTGTAICG